MAMLRSDLAYPGQQIVNDELYNQLVTMHGTIMLPLFAPPVLRVRRLPHHVRVQHTVG